MRKSLPFITLLLLSVLVVFGCKKEDEEDVKGNNMTKVDIVERSMIDLPTCLSSSQSNPSTSLSPMWNGSVSSPRNASTASSKTTAATDVYRGIKQNITALDSWSNIIKKFTREIYKLTHFASQGSWINENPVQYEPTKISWKTSTNPDYDFMVELFYGPAKTKGFQAFLTVNEKNKTAKGRFTWDFHVTKDKSDPSNDSKVEFEFDSTVNPRMMSIKATDLRRPTGSEPEKAWVKATLSSQHVLTLWGNYFFPDMDFFDSTGDTVDAKNYVFAVAGYDDIGQGATKKNKAILQLAIPDATLDTTTAMWDDYSLSKIFIDKIQEVWTARDVSVDLLEQWVEPGTANFSGHSTIASLDDDDVIKILDWAADHSSDSTADGIKQLAFISKLVNPAYYEGNGFLGTWNETRGTLSAKPAGFDDLETSLATVSKEVATPKAVKELTIDF